MSAVLEAVNIPESRLAQTLSADPTPTEQRLKAIIEAAPVSLMVVDSQGKVIAANRAALHMRGAGRLAEFVGKHVCQTIAPHDRQRFVQFLADVCGGASGALEYDLAPVAGSPCAVETHAVPLQRDGAATVFLGITHDVSERRRLESALRRAEAKLEALEAHRSGERPQRVAMPAASSPSRTTTPDPARQRQALLERDAMIESLRQADRQASSVEEVFQRNPTAKQASMVSRLLRRGK